MLKKALIILGILVVGGSLWITIRAFQHPNNNFGVFLLKGDFLTSLSRQVLKGLPTASIQGHAQVSIKDFGDISPYYGRVIIKKNIYSISGSTLSSEYVVVQANRYNTKPIDISNWSLQSMVTPIWIGLPQGASRYEAGVVNTLSDIFLAPGEKAIISTGASPVGVSFRVNACSGYLNAFQGFTPQLNTTCELPQQILPPTVANIKTYGDACLQLVNNLRSCTYVTASVAGFSDTSTACRSFLQPRFTYNTCVAQRTGDTRFYAPREWRVFLNQKKRIWKDSYEVIRLLDEKNRTVAVFNY